MTTSGKEDPKANAGRGTGAAVVGAVMGLVPVTVSDYLRFQLLADEPDPTLFLAGHFALTLVYASPYLLILMASKVRKTNTRGGLLAALGLLSLAASFSLLSPTSPTSLILLPATFVIWFAAARSLTASIRPLAATVAAAGLGMAVAVTVGLGFYALYGAPFALFGQGLGERCWSASLNPDGRYVRYGDIQPFCVSDYISNAEAAMSVGILAIAFLAMILTIRLPWIRSPDSSRA